MSNYNPAWSIKFKSVEPQPSDFAYKIKELEKLTTYPIMGEYRGFIDNLNGGVSADSVNVFNINDFQHRFQVPQKIKVLFGFNTNNKEDDLIEVYKKYRDRLCADILPIGRTSTGNLICIKLDYRNPVFILDLSRKRFIKNADYDFIVEGNSDFTVDSATNSVERVKFRPTYDDLYFVSQNFSGFLAELYDSSGIL